MLTNYSNKELVSIIIPVYNTSKYLPKCIKSIIEQTYRNFELIIVDDGSTDNSFEIAKTYEKIDSRISVTRINNSGVSAARNLGFSLAKGDYITFIDSDDTITPEYLTVLYSALQLNNDIGLSICEFAFLDESGKYMSRVKKKKGFKIVKIDKDYKFTRTQQHLSACGVLYRKKTIENYQFDESLVIGEDALFNTKAVLNSKYIIFTNKVLYHYIYHETSSFRSIFNFRKCTELAAWQDIVNSFEPYPRAYKSAIGEYSIRCAILYKEILKCSKYDDCSTLKYELVRKIRNNCFYIFYCHPNIYHICITIFIALAPGYIAKVIKLLRN